MIDPPPGANAWLLPHEAPVFLPAPPSGTTRLLTEPKLPRRTDLRVKDAEPSLDHVQLRSSGRGEVEADVGMLGKPLTDLWGRVGRGVIEDHVQFASTIASLHQLQEAQEIRPRVPLRALPPGPCREPPRALRTDW